MEKEVVKANPGYKFVNFSSISFSDIAHGWVRDSLGQCQATVFIMRKQKKSDLRPRKELRRSLIAASLMTALILSLAVASWSFVKPAGAFSRSPSAAALEIPQSGPVFTVNMTGDAPQANKAKGCDTDILTFGDQCTLRAALTNTNTLSGGATIEFNIPLTQPGCNAATGKCTITLTDKLPDITAPVEIKGPGLDRLTVRRETSGTFNPFRIFTVTTSGTVSFYGLTISNGDVGAINELGGGILADRGDVNINNSAISENSAAAGGGVATGVNHLGTINITNSLIFSNRATGTSGIYGGGGILVISTTANVTNTIVYGNAASRAGGLLNMSGSVGLSNSTFTRNTAQDSNAGQGIEGPALVKGTIIAKNGSGADVAGNYTSAGFNLVGQTGSSTGFSQPSDQTGRNTPLDPKLREVTLFGLPFVFQVQPLCTSPALDQGNSAGLTGSLTTDMRGAGFPRTLDDSGKANAAGGDGADIGAIERPINCAHVPPTFTVNTTSDGDDFAIGDQVCDSDPAAGRQCSLRAAIQEANAITEDNSEIPNSGITFSIPVCRNPTAPAARAFAPST